MSAHIPDDSVNVEVDGVPRKAKKGAMIIHVTDAVGAYVPRFCYHDKLPIAANCRMCLVEVEKAPKPLPACATPVTEGMKIFTRSPNAIAAQKATMEFLLINHPLDCPICDQGGECELQDLAMGFGRDLSRFHERKRVVKDKDLGPLVSTDMTRCIHCTRCVRFGQDVAGIQELGTLGRGENTQIGTWIERSVDHEMSGNIIDLCPVGALNSKPFRYHGRSWEMTQQPLVSPHDPVGSNLYGHVLRGRLMRVVPRPNDEINETWISDRDRFSYEGVYSDDRLLSPRIRDGAGWKNVGWEQALRVAAEGLKARGASLGVLASSCATVEELYLAARLARGLGSSSIDHRLRQSDFRATNDDPVAPLLGLPLTAVDALTGLLIVGSNLRAEAPILAHRVRKAARKGASVALLNPADYEYLFPVAAQLSSPPASLLSDLLAVLAVLVEGAAAPAAWVERLRGVTPSATHRALAAALTRGERRAVWLGALSLRHPAWADLRSVAAAIAQLAGATLGVISEGSNSAGAWFAGAVPHRAAGGERVAAPGLDARAMLAADLRAYLLLGALDPGLDFAVDTAHGPAAAEFVVALTPYVTPEIERIAHVLLPMGSFAETSGTYVNLEGRWQSFAGAARPLGEARPGWKVLRVLGNLLDLPQFEYQSSEQVRDELQAKCVSAAEPGGVTRAGEHVPGATAPQGAAVADVSIYQSDALVRRAPALQATLIGRAPARSY